jgi:hypothetical protein
MLSILWADGLACWMACRRCIQWHISYVSSITQVIGYGSSSMRFLDYTQRRAHSVGLLWTSGQLVAETSTWKHTTRTTDKHPYPGGIRTHDHSGRASADLRLRPRGYWDRLKKYTSLVCKVSEIFGQHTV